MAVRKKDMMTKSGLGSRQMKLAAAIAEARLAVTDYEIHLITLHKMSKEDCVRHAIDHLTGVILKELGLISDDLMDWYKSEDELCRGDKNT